MSDNVYHRSNTTFVSPNSGWNKGVVFAVAGMISFGIVLVKELNKNAKEKHRKYI